MTRYYLDTSVAVHALRGTVPAERWFDEVAANGVDEFVSSRILRTELTRVLRRDAAAVSGRDLIMAHVGTIPVSEAVLTTAESIADHVKTLDAIHLASALQVGSETVLVTHDANLARVATNLGLHCHDPVV